MAFGNDSGRMGPVRSDKRQHSPQLDSRWATGSEGAFHNFLGYKEMDREFYFQTYEVLLILPYNKVKLTVLDRFPD